MSTHTLNSDVAALALTAHFAVQGAPFATPGYYKDTTGHVHLRGLLSTLAGVSVGETISTLPAGFRPGATLTFFVMDGQLAPPSSAGVRIDINTAGQIIWQGPAVAGHIPALEGIPPFLAEN